MWNKNEREGNIDQAKGKVKQAVGDLTGNDKLKAEGRVDETVGNAKTAVGKAQKKVGAAVESIGKALKRFVLRRAQFLAGPTLLKSMNPCSTSVRISCTRTGAPRRLPQNPAPVSLPPEDRGTGPTCLSRRAGNDGVELFPDPRLQQHRRCRFPHLPFHLLGRILLFGAVLRQLRPVRPGCRARAARPSQPSAAAA